MQGLNLYFLKPQPKKFPFGLHYSLWETSGHSLATKTNFLWTVLCFSWSLLALHNDTIFRNFNKFHSLLALKYCSFSRTVSNLCFSFCPFRSPNTYCGWSDFRLIQFLYYFFKYAISTRFSALLKIWQVSFIITVIFGNQLTR